MSYADILLLSQPFVAPGRFLGVESVGRRHVAD
jgi:hypothetical protein